MSAHMTGLIIGGVAPAFLFAFANLFIKSSSDLGIGTGPYLLCAGAAILGIGLVISITSSGFAIPLKAGSYAFCAGLTWGAGVALVSIAIAQYKTPMSILVPLFNMNTLVAVLLALWIFAEWKQVHLPRLAIGTVLITVGGILVAKS
jgi:hypothetical protein